MIRLLKLATLFSVFAATQAFAVPMTDLKDYSNNVLGVEFFVDVDANKIYSPWYRDASQDWGWTHGGLAGTGFASIVLEISGYDVDSPAESDSISIWDGGAFVSVGDLVGTNDSWDFTTIDLSGYGWAEAQVNAGLQVQMDIDSANEGWLVTLGKAVLSVDGGTLDCVPTPGVPCAAIPEPSVMALFGLGLVGLGFARRRMK